ncbi:MAG: alpha/beta hydrolase [Acidobacteriota bacterium]
MGILKRLCLAFALLMSQVAHAEIETADVVGFVVEYELKGEGREFVVLEAGGGGGLEDWSGIFERLSQSVRVLRYSRVGNGGSDNPERYFMVEDYAEHLKQLLDRLDVAKIIHVAHSYGGSVARVFAAKYPERVEGLLLIDASSEHDVDIMRSIDLERANREIEAVKLDDLRGGKSGHVVDFWAKFPLPDYPAIPDIPVTVIASVKRYESPGHLLHSDEGRRLWGALWTEWAEAFPKGKAVLTRNSHHLIPQEEPELVVAEAEEIVARCRAEKSEL